MNHKVFLNKLAKAFLRFKKASLKFKEATVPKTYRLRQRCYFFSILDDSRDHDANCEMKLEQVVTTPPPPPHKKKNNFFFYFLNI